MTTLLIATRNAHKVQEIRQILGDGVRCLTLNDFPGAPVAVEDANTFAGNAARKVLSLAEWLARDAGPAARLVAPEDAFYIVADDSGLEVDALGGAPGVHSARFAAPDAAVSGNTPDSANNAKLIRLLGDRPIPERTARFRCVLAVLPMGLFPPSVRPVYSPEEINYFDGVCEGKIMETAAGKGGFGYDPLFVPDGFGQSFAELGAEAKNKLSHRGRALGKLREFLNKRNS
jgi:XTP/dITP diphosphohydrolase